MNTKEELQRIKSEVNERENKEKKEKEEEKKDLERQIRRKAERYAKFVIDYFLDKRIAECAFEFKIGFFLAKGSFFDERSITKEYIKAFNSLSSYEERGIFIKYLEEELKMEGISFEIEFHYGGDFLFSAADKYEVHLKII